MLNRNALTFICLLLFVLAGCKSPVTGGQKQYVIIDNMERPDGSAEFTWQGGAGMWSVSTVESGHQAGSVSPPPPFEVSDGWAFDKIDEHETFPNMHSMYAARLRTTRPEGMKLNPTEDFSGGQDSGVHERNWGANMNVDFIRPEILDGGPDVGRCVISDATSTKGDEICRLYEEKWIDLSSYVGLGFWARAASTGKQTIYVQVQDVNSDPRGCLCASNPCDKEAVKDGCYNSFAKSFVLSDVFERYEVDFSELRRDPNWGHGALHPLDPRKITTISFEVRSPKCVAVNEARCVGNDPEYLSFDFWIDDLYLVKRVP